MMTTMTGNALCILGRQPALGIAELESLYGSEAISLAGNEAALIHADAESIPFARIGGVIKLASVLTVLDTTNWRDIEQYLVQNSRTYASRLPEGKMYLGVSTYGIKVNPKQIMASGLSLKKVIRSTGRPVRLVPNVTPELNTAQVIHNRLTGDHGTELICLRDGDHTIVAQTIFIQDIESYTDRDRGRPKRDARVGMLPPKLAQIIVNLASSTTVQQDTTILDPFCGTGVILQEALLSGFNVYGTDLETRMVEYSNANLEWLTKKYSGVGGSVLLDTGDATSYSWKKKIDIIATETYLGRPLTNIPEPAILQKIIGDCNLIISKFLKNAYHQIKPGTRLCLAVPAWHVSNNSFRHLPLIDQIDEMGYNRVSFEHVRDHDLLYYRENQIVARELLVITRK